MQRFGRNPFKDFLDMQDEVNRMFRRSFLGESVERTTSEGRINWIPAVDVYENKEALVLLVELPGVEKKDVEISIEEDILSISGKRKIHEEMKEENVHRMERAYGRFARRIQLPHKVDEQGIKASFVDGILKIELPKVKEEIPKRIPIVTEESEGSGE